MLFSPESHEPLTDDPWDAGRVRREIAAVVTAVESAFDDGWPVHERDEHDGLTAKKPRSVYLGGAGVVAALHRLAQRGFAEARRDYVPYLQESTTAPLDWGGADDRRSLFFGETGIRLVLQRVAPSDENLALLAGLIAANERDETRELMSGSPGTILAGRELGLDVSAGVDWLRAQRDEDGLWTQTLDGKRHRLLGAAHGLVGCALALGEDPSAALAQFAVAEDGLVNWAPLADAGLVDSNRDRLIRTQWCHGAVGIVATLGSLLDEELALAGGELTWRAGPLAKGGGLCHGTAGNGYAFLALFERTGDELWLARARAFAMHAQRQLEPDRYSLWTGGIGTALYLADCVDGAGTLPIP